MSTESIWDILIYILEDINNRYDKQMEITNRILRGSKNIYLKIIDIVRNILLVETILYYRGREQSTTYIELCGVCVAIILVFVAINIIQGLIHTNYIEYEWFHAQNTLQMDIKTKLFNRLQWLSMLGMIGYVCFVLPAAYFYVDTPTIVYSLLLLVNVLGLCLAFEEDRMLWHITIGRRLSMHEAGSIYDIVMHNRPDDWWQADGDWLPQCNTLDMRYMMCDALRKDHTKLHTVNELLKVCPAYVCIRDRDGVTTPFELACQFASPDIILFMINKHDGVPNYWDTTKLHIACRRETPGSLKLVNYILEKQMQLVTNTNKDGDLPIHVACDTVNKCSLEYQTEAIEIVWRLLLAYPECLSCVSGSTVIRSNEKDIDDKKNR